MTPVQRHARASQTHVLSHARLHEGCWWCSPWHSAPKDRAPERCWECELDRQEGVRRWMAK